MGAAIPPRNKFRGFLAEEIMETIKQINETVVGKLLAQLRVELTTILLPRIEKEILDTAKHMELMLDTLKKMQQAETVLKQWRTAQTENTSKQKLAYSTDSSHPSPQIIEM